MSAFNQHYTTVGYKIVDTNKEDISKIIEIADNELGKFYLDKNSFNSGESRFLRVAKQEKGTVLGFCLSHIVSQTILEQQLGLVLNHESDISNVGLIKTVAVSNKYQKNGIGYNLVADAITIIKQQKIKPLLCLAWKSKNGVNIDGIMKQHQFSVLKEISNYWKNDSIKHSYNCPECGHPCNCSALIYLKTIK